MTTGNQPEIEIAVFIRDLIFETKIKSTAQSLGIGAATVRSIVDLDSLLASASVRLLVVDLNSAGPAGLDGIRAAKKLTGLRVLAFVSHVDAELASLASEAGADEVLPRSRFTAQLPELLTKACRPA